MKIGASGNDLTRCHMHKGKAGTIGVAVLNPALVGYDDRNKLLVVAGVGPRHRLLADVEHPCQSRDVLQIRHTTLFELQT